MDFHTLGIPIFSALGNQSVLRHTSTSGKRKRHCAPARLAAIGTTAAPRLFRPPRAPAPSPDVPASLSIVAIDSPDRRAAAVGHTVRRAW